jgi:hypothetical protein
MNPLLTSVLLLLPGCAALAATNNPATDWFCRAGYGVFVHYLNELQNNAATIQSLGRSTSWDECVREFDAERFASAMAEAGAGYVIFTTHQRTRFLIAPNATFDRLTGYKPGEACATRDLIEDLYPALHRRNIPLMLYWTGNGPSSDPKASAALGWRTPVADDYVANWSSVAEEYALRYGEKVAGWWVDGCYVNHGGFGWTDGKLAPLARALKAGHPGRIVALNPGVELSAYSAHDDYTAGEQNTFAALPESRWLGGKQWHVLSYLGCERADNYLSAGWCEPGAKYGKRELADYVRAVNRKGGTVSIDVLLYRDGGIDRSQLEVLKALRPALIPQKNPEAVPPGNLAYRKPARLLSLDGLRELPVNGNGVHKPELGVDGFPDTSARASDEWPWTYEVDLGDTHALRRVKVTFSRHAYATRIRLTVSPDGKRWREVAAAETPAGNPVDRAFAPVIARYVRVSALKPDGPGQPGEQMAIGELEVYD